MKAESGRKMHLKALVAKLFKIKSQAIASP